MTFACTGHAHGIYNVCTNGVHACAVQLVTCMGPADLQLLLLLLLPSYCLAVVAAAAAGSRQSANPPCRAPGTSTHGRKGKAAHGIHMSSNTPASSAAVMLC